jgi:hypothetical protein
MLSQLQTTDLPSIIKGLHHMSSFQLYSRRLSSLLFIRVFISSSPQHVIRASPTELTGRTKMAVTFTFTCLVAISISPIKVHLSAIQLLATDIYIDIDLLTLPPHLEHIHTHSHITIHTPASLHISQLEQESDTTDGYTGTGRSDA